MIVITIGIGKKDVKLLKEGNIIVVDNLRINGKALTIKLEMKK